MNNQGTVILRGRVGSDLRSMTSQSGTKGIRFRLAASQWRINDSGKYEERDPHWYTVCVWDRLAKNLLSSVEKGTPIIVSGRPSARAWIGPDSEARAELVINASFCGIDLAFNPAAVMKPKIPQHNVQESATVEAGEYAAQPDMEEVSSNGVYRHDPGAPDTHCSTGERNGIGTEATCLIEHCTGDCDADEDRDSAWEAEESDLDGSDAA
ncbi:single-stranded DNA-binding protein [uncultured Actinomyces sp.]|uniref:single-stranded DNA-binding protein n=1 Tax=uncultured Actinomyces sp. TaxID=249061 RepID=UPI002636EBED|nr:single-stranded DNA-binding protein [uncultured Actinomyces sp.]